MTNEEGSIVKKAAEEQQQLDNQPTPAPTPAPTADPVYDPVTKTMKAPGMNGGFFVGSMPTPSTPQPQQQGPSSPQSITDIQQKMAALQAELNAYQQQGTAPTSPTPAPVREPPKSPMFGVDIPQQAATSPTPPRQSTPPTQTPQQKPREP